MAPVIPPQGAPPPGPGGYVPASSSQKTMIAGMAPSIPAPGPGGFAPGAPPPGFPPAGFPPQGYAPSSGAPAKTMMLQPSEGIVSVATTGRPLAAVDAVVDGASALFWIVCMVTGVAVGALAYAVVLQF
jgi:hypothetical protein